MPRETYRKNRNLARIDTKIANHKLLSIEELWKVLDCFPVPEYPEWISYDKPHHGLQFQYHTAPVGIKIYKILTEE
jgi:hypothetical protein